MKNGHAEGTGNPNANGGSGGEERSQRPIWLGIDERRFDHMRVHVALLHDMRVGAIEQAVYLGLAAHAELRSGECFPSVDTLVQYTQVSEKRVRQALHRLRDTGWIGVTIRSGKASEYHLLPPPVIPTPVAGTDLVGDGPVAGTDLVRYLSLSRSVGEANAIRKNKNQEREPLNDAGAKTYPQEAPQRVRDGLARIPEPKPWCVRCEGTGWVPTEQPGEVVECPACGEGAALCL